MLFYAIYDLYKSKQSLGIKTGIIIIIYRHVIVKVHNNLSVLYNFKTKQFIFFLIVFRNIKNTKINLGNVDRYK